MSQQTLKHVFSTYYEENMMPKALFDKMFKDVKMNLGDDESFYDPIVADFDDFDERHNKSLIAPIYLNDFDFNIAEDREAIIGLLRTEYDQNNFSTIGSCNCGKYRANMYVGKNFVCDECGSPVLKTLANNFETKVWLKCPANIQGFINPALYATFFRRLNTKTPKVNVVDFWTDPSVRRETRFRDKNSTAYKIALKLTKFRDDLGIKFGYNEFIKNADLIVGTLLTNDYLRILDLKPDDRVMYAEFWAKYKARATSHYFPVPNKIMTIVESDNRNRYFTKEQLEVNRVFQTIADLYKADDERNSENPMIMGKIYRNLVNSLETIQKSVLFGKKGSIRYHAGAGKIPFTGRTIITGSSGVNRTDTIIVPWEFVLTCLDKHLTNWLYRRGYTPMKVKKIIRNAANKICPIVEEFVNWVEENNYAIAIAGRNPSIQYLSARALFVRFNRDIDDKSMRIPILGTTLWGADFDGDQMYIRFLPDLISKIESYSAWGHQQMLDPNKLFTAGKSCFQTKTNLISFNSLLRATPIQKT